MSVYAAQLRSAASTLNGIYDLQHSETLHGAYTISLEIAAAQSGKSAHIQKIRGFLDVPLEALVEQLTAAIPSVKFVVHRRAKLDKTYSALKLSEIHGPDTRKANSVDGYWDDGFFTLELHHDGQATFHVGSLDYDAMNVVADLLDRALSTKARPASIAVIAQGQHGPSLINVGEGGTPFIVGNYPPSIVHAFEHVATDLGKNDPCGRLTILTGPPGTGKTYWIEGLIAAQAACRYILIPPSLLQSIAAPELLRVILPDEDYDRSIQKRLPTVFLIEDADECLTRRDLGTLPAISTILNLADGILGRALDVRVVATSNARRTDIDEALLRDGRLCRAIDFMPLDATQAAAVYEREWAKAFEGMPPISNPFHDAIGKAKGAQRKVGFHDAAEAPTFVLAEVYRAVKEAVANAEATP